MKTNTSSHFKAVRYWIFSVKTLCRFNYINILDKGFQTPATLTYFRIEPGLFLQK